MKIIDIFEAAVAAVTSTTPTRPIQPVQGIQATTPNQRRRDNAVNKPQTNPSVEDLEGQVLSAGDHIVRKQALQALAAVAPDSLIVKYFGKHRMVGESKFIATFIKKDMSYFDHTIHAKDRQEAMSKAAEIIKSLKDTIQLKDLEQSQFSEARVPGLNYKDEYKGKKDPVLDRVILTLTGKDSEILTKLGLRYKKLDNLQKMITEQRNAMNATVKEKMDDLFDAEDIFITREIDTVSATMVLAKKGPGSDAVPARVETVIEWDQVAQEIMLLLDEELLPKAQLILANYTKINRIAAIPAQEPKSPALRVEPKESLGESLFYVKKPDGEILSYVRKEKAEQVAGRYNTKVLTSISKEDEKNLKFKESVNEGILDNIKAYTKKFLNAFKSWGAKYDHKLDTVNAHLAKLGAYNESVTETDNEPRNMSMGGANIGNRRLNKDQFDAEYERALKTQAMLKKFDKKEEPVKEDSKPSVKARMSMSDVDVFRKYGLKTQDEIMAAKKHLRAGYSHEAAARKVKPINEYEAGWGFDNNEEDCIDSIMGDIQDRYENDALDLLKPESNAKIKEIIRDAVDYYETKMKDIVPEINSKIKIIRQKIKDGETIEDFRFPEHVRNVQEDTTKIPEITGTPTFWTNVVEEASKGKLFDQKFESGYYTGIVKTKYAKQVDKISKRLGDILNKDIKLITISKSYSASKDKIAIDNALHYLGYDNQDEVDTTNFVVIEVELKTKSTFPGMKESSHTVPNKQDRIVSTTNDQVVKLMKKYNINRSDAVDRFISANITKIANFTNPDILARELKRIQETDGENEELATIKDIPIVGNHSADAHLFVKLDNVIRNEKLSLKVRLAALAHFDKIMGVDVGPVSKQDLDDYMTDALQAEYKDAGIKLGEDENTDYAKRVAELEAEGMTTSDAQGVADAEALKKNKKLSPKEISKELAAIGVGIKFDKEWDEYKVFLKDDGEGKSYHTDDLQDAFHTGVAMAKRAEGFDKFNNRIKGAVNEDWGSSDWSIVINNMKKEIARLQKEYNYTYELAVHLAAEDESHNFYQQMGYERPSQATQRIVHMFFVRTEAEEERNKKAQEKPEQA